VPELAAAITTRGILLAGGGAVTGSSSGLRITGRGRGSGVEVEMHQAWAYLLRDGKVVELSAGLGSAQSPPSAPVR
jgi:hypothetical protein